MKKSNSKMAEQEHKNINELLSELMSERNVTADKLSDATNIPKRFIISLINGNAEDLPARPYVRGYLFKIAEALKVDSHILWQSYRISDDFRSSGGQDKLPINRFAFKKIRASRVVATLFIIVVLVFVGFRFNDILGRPTLNVSLPELTSEETITVTGDVSPGDRLTLNLEVIYPDETGSFEKRIRLEPGLNTLEFRIKRYLGQEAIFVKQVFYQPSGLSQ